MKFRTNIEQRLSGRHKKCLEIIDFTNKKILDIGCGYGWFERFTEKKAKEIIALDPNREDLENARKEVSSRKVRFVLGSAKNLSKLKIKDFDVITMFDVIEHIPRNSELGTLIQIKDMLKKGGKLIISTPADNVLCDLLDPAWYFGHRHYSRKKLGKLLSDSGLAVKNTEIKGGFFEISSMILFYPFKWIFNLEIPFKSFFDKKRDHEYLGNKGGIVTLFATAEK